MSEPTQGAEPLSEIDIALKKLDYIQRHIEYVMEACDILGRKLIEQGEIDAGIKLISNSYLHDNSKFSSALEWANLNGFSEDKDAIKLAIQEHRAKNPHHAEYWGGLDKIPEIYLQELICDLYARAIEFGTNLRDYIKDVYIEKHNIAPNGKTCKLMKKYVDMLLEKPFKSI